MLQGIFICLFIKQSHMLVKLTRVKKKVKLIESARRSLSHHLAQNTKQCHDPSEATPQKHGFQGKKGAEKVYKVWKLCLGKVTKSQFSFPSSLSLSGFSLDVSSKHVTVNLQVSIAKDGTPYHCRLKPNS